MADARKYAEGTEVSADKSRLELEALLDKHGATQFATLREADRTTLVYELHGRRVKQVVEYPTAKDYVRDPKWPSWHSPRPADQVKKLQEAEWRRRWRAQVLIVKAKLEIIASGGSTFEREFLADTMLPNGETVGEAMLPRIAEAYLTGAMPRLLLGSGDK